MNIRRVKLLRVIVTGPMEEHGKALDWCYSHGYRITQSGPRINRGEGPTIDGSKFKVVAEK